MRVWEAVEYILADHYVSDAEAAQVLEPSFATNYNDGYDHSDDVQRDRQALQLLARALNDPNISLDAGAAQRIVNDLTQLGYQGLQVPPPRAARIPQPQTVPNAVNGSPLTGADPQFQRLSSVARHPRPGDELVNIAVNDLPVDFNHPALRDHLKDARAAYDFTTHTRGPTPDPTQWHGTANAVLGTQGTPWLRVMANKVMPAPDYAATYESIQPAIDRGARVINISAGLGFQGNNAAFVKMVKDHPRVLFVVAAGNDGVTFDVQNAESLGAFNNVPNLMVVGSSTREGGISAESARGAPWVTIAAQGEGVWVPFSMQQAAIGNAWTLANGTSFACPQVSNCGGKMMLLCPDLDAVQINVIMQQTVDRVQAWQGMNAAGGVLNPARAMSVAAAISLVREQGSSIEQALGAVGFVPQDAAFLAPLMRAILTQLAQATPPPQPTPTWAPPAYNQ